MKKLIILLFLSAISIGSHAFSLQARCNVNRANATCFVQNHLPRPVYCQAQANGFTSYGYVAKVYGNGWIYPGQVMALNVYALNPYNDPLLNANVFTDCRF